MFNKTQFLTFAIPNGHSCTAEYTAIIVHKSHHFIDIQQIESRSHRMPQFMETNPNLIQEPTFSDQNLSEQWISEGGNSSGNNFTHLKQEVVSATISSFRNPLLASILV